MEVPGRVEMIECQTMDSEEVAEEGGALLKDNEEGRAWISTVDSRQNRRSELIL